MAETYSLEQIVRRSAEESKKYTDKGTSAIKKDLGDLESQVSESIDEIFENYIANMFNNNEHQKWNPFTVKYGGYYQCNGNYVENATSNNITFDVEEGKTYYFAMVDKTSATGVKTGNANYICPVKADGSYYYSSATEQQWKGNYTVPVGSGITKLIVSNPNSRLVDGMYSITDYAPNTAQPSKEKYENRIDVYEGSKVKISCIGDSLTEGSGGNGTNYPDVIASNNSDLIVYKMGHPSKDSEYIASAIGAMALYVQPFTIPSGTTPVNILLKNESNGAVTLDKLSVGINPVTIDGIAGTLSINNGSLQFTRGASGTAKTIERPVRLISNFEKNHLGDICVFWVGTNNQNGSINSETCTVINIIKNMVEKLPHKKYIVIAPTAKSYHSNVDSIQVYFKRIFGFHFVNLRQYLLDYGLADAGITPTEQDETDITNGEIPSSLRSDTVHFNAQGYTVIGNYLYKELVNRGYI